MRRLYQSRANRDAEWRRQRAAGKAVRRSSIRGQQLHPQYVCDYEGPEAQQTGIGNTVYKTYFPVLYILEDDRGFF